MKTKLSALLLFLLGLACACAADAQTVVKGEPFGTDETLTYEGSLSKLLPVPGFGANLSFNIAAAPDGKNYVITTEAVSKGNLFKLSGYKFLQKYESTVERENFRILKTVKHVEERDRDRDSFAAFNYRQEQVTYVETDPKDAMRPPRRIASAILPDTLDLVSGVYEMRRLPLSVGKTFELSISDSGLVYRIPVRVAAREQQNSILGKLWCFRVEPEVFGANRLIDDKGKMAIWIADDERRIPVRAQIQSGFGTIEVKLKKIGK